MFTKWENACAPVDVQLMMDTMGNMSLLFAALHVLLKENLILRAQWPV